MVMLGELLQERKDIIVRRWLEEALATYPPDGAAAFAREKDPFSNPVGHHLREATEGIVSALIAGEDADAASGHLVDIIRIRAVQQFTASQAVGFVFWLKRSIRQALEEVAGDPAVAAALLQLDARIDEIGLRAFDRYSQCREQLLELRINEVKRSVAWSVERLNRGPKDGRLVQLEPRGEVADDGNGRREGAR